MTTFPPANCTAAAIPVPRFVTVPLKIVTTQVVPTPYSNLILSDFAMFDPTTLTAAVSAAVAYEKMEYVVPPSLQKPSEVGAGPNVLDEVLDGIRFSYSVHPRVSATCWAVAPSGIDPVTGGATSVGVAVGDGVSDTAGLTPPTGPEGVEVGFVAGTVAGELLPTGAAVPLDVHAVSSRAHKHRVAVRMMSPSNCTRSTGCRCVVDRMARGQTAHG